MKDEQYLKSLLTQYQQLTQAMKEAPSPDIHIHWLLQREQLCIRNFKRVLDIALDNKEEQK